MIVLRYNQSIESGVLAHAFSLGKPVIVTDVGGLMTEVQTNSAGVVVFRDNLNQLKDYIVLFLSNKDARDKYAREVSIV